MANILDLDQDGIESVLLSANLKCLAQLSCTCSFFKGAVADPAFLTRLRATHESKAAADSEADEKPAEPGFILPTSTADSLEALAVVEAMRNLRTNHITFHLGSLQMVSKSKALLSEYAEILRNHPGLRLRIDSHTGVGAPPHIAPSHSVERAKVVVKYLARKGIAASRLRACAWGMDVGRARRWPASQAYARVEIFVAFGTAVEAAAADSSTADSDGRSDDVTDEEQLPETDFPLKRCLPTWPSYYVGLQPRTASIDLADETEETNQDSDDSGDDDSVSGMGVPQGLLQMLQGLGADHVIQMSNGQVISAAGLLGALLQGNAVNNSDDDEDGVEIGIGSSESDDDDEVYGDAVDNDDDNDDDDEEGVGQGQNDEAQEALVGDSSAHTEPPTSWEDAVD